MGGRGKQECRRNKAREEAKGKTPHPGRSTMPSSYRLKKKEKGDYEYSKINAAAGDGAAKGNRIVRSLFLFDCGKVVEKRVWKGVIVRE